MASKKASEENKRKMAELRKKSRYHNTELQKVNRNESKILKNEGFEHKSNILIWIFIIIAIIVAIVWFFIFN